MGPFVKITLAVVPRPRVKMVGIARSTEAASALLTPQVLFVNVCQILVPPPENTLAVKARYVKLCNVVIRQTAITNAIVIPVTFYPIAWPLTHVLQISVTITLNVTLMLLIQEATSASANRVMLALIAI